MPLPSGFCSGRFISFRFVSFRFGFRFRFRFRFLGRVRVRVAIRVRARFEPFRFASFVRFVTSRFAWYMLIRFVLVWFPSGVSSKG